MKSDFIGNLLVKLWKKIEHVVNQHAGNRNIHPDKPNIFCYSLMFLKITCKCLPDNIDYKRQLHRRKYDMRYKYDKINGTSPIMKRIWHRADFKMINQIRHQKGRRRTQSSYHKLFMSLLVPFFNIDKPKSEQNC